VSTRVARALATERFAAYSTACIATSAHAGCLLQRECYCVILRLLRASCRAIGVAFLHRFSRTLCNATRRENLNAARKKRRGVLCTHPAEGGRTRPRGKAESRQSAAPRLRHIPATAAGRRRGLVHCERRHRLGLETGCGWRGSSFLARLLAESERLRLRPSRRGLRLGRGFRCTGPCGRVLCRLAGLLERPRVKRAAGRELGSKLFS
jgi:hypothetical protein